MKSLFICLALAAATTACSVKSETVKAQPTATTTTVATPAASTTYVTPAPAATTTVYTR